MVVAFCFATVGVLQPSGTMSCSTISYSRFDTIFQKFQKEEKIIVAFEDICHVAFGSLDADENQEDAVDEVYTLLS